MIAIGSAGQGVIASEGVETLVIGSLQGCTKVVENHGISVRSRSIVGHILVMMLEWQALFDGKDEPQSRGLTGKQQGYPGWERVRTRQGKVSSRHLAFPPQGLASSLMCSGGEGLWGQWTVLGCWRQR